MSDPFMITQASPQVYRLFRIDDAGRISGTPDIIQAVDDDRAIAAAVALAGRCPAEVWSGARLVATLDHDDRSSSRKAVET